MESFLLMSQKENKLHSTQLKPFSFYHSRIPENAPDVALHWHTEIEINMVIEGKGYYQVGDKHITAVEGDIVIISPNILHSVYTDTHIESSTFVFSPELLGVSFYDKASVSYIRPIINGIKIFSPFINSQTDNYTEIYQCVKNIFDIGKNESEFYELILKSELYKLIYMLYSNRKMISQNDSPKYFDKIKTALQYIQENYQENITVSELAELCHFSKAYFMSFFKKNVGIPCVEYIMQFRLKKSAEALKTTDKSIAEIAFDCGYRNLSNFNRHFKSYFGVVPKDFRNNNI